MYEPAVRKNVRELRGDGRTFKEILTKFPFLAKGTISRWVEDIALTNEQEKRILNEKLKGQVKFIRYNERKHQEAIENARRTILEGKKEIGKIDKRDLTIAGSALFWGEGSKRERNAIEFVNSDPAAILLMMRFFREILNIEESKFKCGLILHPGLNKEEALNYWSSLAGVPLSQFNKVYVKPPKSSTGKMHNVLYKGTLRIRICDTKNLCRLKGFVLALSEN